MNRADYPPGYFDKNGFQKIDEVVVRGAQALAEKAFNNASFKLAKTNCVIVFKQDSKLTGQVKRDYDSALRQSKTLMELGINSIIYIFLNYPKTVKHHIIDENAFMIENYDGKGKTFIVDVEHIKTDPPVNPSDN